MDFTNYKVSVFLKNGTKSTGLIHAVDASQITLLPEGGSLHRVPSADIADIKVVQLPAKKPQKPKDESRSSTPRSQIKAVAPDMLLDFDFEANLAMFDKRQVFADFLRQDHVDPSQRLVGHNRVKKEDAKYENTEMVLDQAKADAWELIGSPVPAPIPSGIATRQGSTLGAGSLVTFVNPQNQPLTCVSPVQLIEIERMAKEYFGVLPALMAETVAVSLSQLIINRILGGLTRLSNRKNHNLPPLVLLLVGSARNGLRAYATGRHLANHGVRVLAFVVYNEDDDADLRQQQSLFEGAGGKVLAGTFAELTHVMSQLETPVELIIDGLLGYDCRLEDLFYDHTDLTLLYDLANWCLHPQQQQKIMSLDLPLGIDSGSGTAGDIVLRGKWCVLMGMPVTGLMLAYKAQVLVDDVVHYLVDQGVPNKVYQQKANLRKFDKYWYCAELAFVMEAVNE